MAREVRVSPDGDKVAIRGNAPADAWNAWGYFDAVNGGGWVPESEVAGWGVVQGANPVDPPANPGPGEPVG